MDVEIKNVRKVARASFAISGQTGVMGPNGAGKTSICRAVGGALAGVTAPWSLKGRGADGPYLVGPVGKAARVDVIGPKGSVTVEWPSGETTVRGEPPKASALAVGLKRYGPGKPDDRARYFSQTFGATPTEPELRKALRDELIDLIGEDDTVAAVEAAWRTLDTVGWDGAAAQYASEARRSKGRWCEVTGARAYGGTQASAWEPPGLNIGLTVTELRGIVDKAKAGRDAAVAASAIQADEVERLQADVAGLAEHTERAEQTKQRLAQARKDLQQTVDRRAEIATSQIIPTEATCPECGCIVQIVGGTLRKHDAIPEDGETLTLWTEAHHDATKKVEAAVAANAAASTMLGAARSAAAKLSKIGDLNAVAGASIEATTAACDAAERTLAARLQFDRALGLHRDITRDLRIADILGDSGLRRTKAQRVLVLANETLSAMSAVAKFLPVQLDEEFGPTYGGRPYDTLSTSEMMRCDWLMALLFAIEDKSDLLILDGIEVVTPAGRGGLARVLQSHWTNKPVLLGMVLADKSKLPPLEKIGGKALWIEEGIIGGPAP